MESTDMISEMRKNSELHQISKSEYIYLLSPVMFGVISPNPMVVEVTKQK